ncbi:conserved protein of unknown function [Candidatus Nitrosotalea okcheonensis]|uniref:Uncharacterized protein n=1 Tax=Candidatus Nitrosotalea okcheonensis TaxID=1903276 RepID=A0A2H1FFC4_9ARCH|nr:conserved protein of unknown function [Candidatus Nitrosotalea okcheonensis]
MPRPSSLLKPSHPSIGVGTSAYSVIILHDYTRRSLLVPGYGYQLRPSLNNFLPSCIFF